MSITSSTFHFQNLNRPNHQKPILNLPRDLNPNLIKLQINQNKLNSIKESQKMQFIKNHNQRNNSNNNRNNVMTSQFTASNHVPQSFSPKLHFIPEVQVPNNIVLQKSLNYNSVAEPEKPNSFQLKKAIRKLRKILERSATNKRRSTDTTDSNSSSMNMSSDKPVQPLSELQGTPSPPMLKNAPNNNNGFQIPPYRQITSSTPLPNSSKNHNLNNNLISKNNVLCSLNHSSSCHYPVLKNNPLMSSSSNNSNSNENSDKDNQSGNSKNSSLKSISKDRNENFGQVFLGFRKVIKYNLKFLLT